MTNEYLAKEAQRLLNDNVLTTALASMRAEALEALAAAEANDTIKILRHQQEVAVIDGIRAQLEGMILNGPKKANSSGTFA